MKCIISEGFYQHALDREHFNIAETHTRENDDIMHLTELGTLAFEYSSFDLALSDLHRKKIYRSEKPYLPPLELASCVFANSIWSSVPPEIVGISPRTGRTGALPSACCDSVVLTSAFSVRSVSWVSPLDHLNFGARSSVQCQSLSACARMWFVIRLPNM